MTKQFPAIKISNCTDAEKEELAAKGFDEFNDALYKYMPSTNAVARGIKRYSKKYTEVTAKIVVVEGQQIIMELN